MYTPAHFAGDDRSRAEFLSSIEVAHLVTMTDDGLTATFLPLIFAPEQGDDGALLGHVARKNDQWRRPAHGDALVIAHGEDAYITPTWYATKKEHGRVVPTWDYTTAHIYGQLRIRDDPVWVDALVRRLTERHESRRAESWSVDDAPAGFHAGQLRAIVGVELLVSRVEAKFKMSQNRSEADIDGVVDGLSADGLPHFAELVQQLRP